MPNNNKKLWLSLGILAVVVIIVVVLVQKNKNFLTPAAPQPTGTAPSSTPSATTAVAATTGATGKIVDLKNTRVAIPGASLITKDNIVVTSAGTIAKNDVIPASAEAPKSVLIAKDQLPKQTVNIEIAGGVFKPSSFTVKAGAPVSFAITSADGLTHVVIFNSAVLGAIAMGIGPGETKAIVFNAPTVAGEYEFRCDVPGHRGSGAGEIGKMIVQ